MINIKSPHEIECMRKSGAILRDCLLFLGDRVKPGVSTKRLDEFAYDYIKRHDSTPSFLGYGGFPGSACISINQEIIHGIPSSHRIIEEGDIVKIDVGAYIHGFHGDSANTFPVGKISDEAARLIEATKKSFEVGVAAAEKEGARIGDIGAAVNGYVESMGYSTVRKYVGHGVGRDLHEDPSVPNYGTPGRGPRISRGMVIAIEPMVNAGGTGVLEQPDGWTVLTADGKLSAHYEHTVAITDEGALLLTKVD